MMNITEFLNIITKEWRKKVVQVYISNCCHVLFHVEPTHFHTLAHNQKTIKAALIPCAPNQQPPEGPNERTVIFPSLVEIIIIFTQTAL